jgi:hypothetical protein
MKYELYVAHLIIILGLDHRTPRSEDHEDLPDPSIVPLYGVRAELNATGIRQVFIPKRTAVDPKKWIRR